jgi:hypothetical protein
MNKLTSCFIRFLLLVIGLIVGSYIYGQKGMKREVLNSGSNIIIRSCYAGKESRKIYVPPPEKFYMKRGDSKSSNVIQVALFDFPMEAKVAFMYAMNIWSSLIESPVDINVTAHWSSMSSQTLGSTYLNPSFVVRGSLIGALEPDALYPYPIAEKMLGEEINNPEDYEVEMTINSNQDWYFGTDGNTDPDKYDLVCVVLHEMGHGLGFYSTMTEYNGLGYYGYTSGLTYYFDHFIRNGANQQLINTSLFENGSEQLLNQYISNNLYYTSPIALSVNSGASPKLYAPILEFDHGSSISHLDESTFPSGTQNALMTPFIHKGEAVHNPGPIMMAILAEIGWVHTYIEHDTLKDAETLDNPFTVTTSVTSDTSIQSDGLYLYYSTDEFQSHDSIPLIETGTPGEYTVDMPVADTGFNISYYIQVEDYFNRKYRKPSAAPDDYFQFFVGMDHIFPLIDHEPFPFILASFDSVQISADVTDNLGIDSVYIEYFINEDPMEPIRLSNSFGDTYRGPIEFEDGTLAAGDSIRYRLFAVDGSTSGNITVSPDSGYYKLSVGEIKSAVDIYENDFNTEFNDFLLQKFSFATPSNFSNPALHTSHPYEESGNNNKSVEYFALLTYPIILDDTDARMKFDEIVLVEPGEDGTVFGDSEFWDYVIVEGSKDTGKAWFPLLPGYDSRINTIWNATYNSTINNGNSLASGASNMLREREIDLLAGDEFNGGDTILIRFRLYSDAFSFGWGWVIDNLRIQGDFSGIESSLFQDDNVWIYPNPVSDWVTIKGKLKTGISKLNIVVTDILGRNVLVKEIETSNDEFYESINLSGLEPGMYLIHIKSDNIIHTLKIILSD